MNFVQDFITISLSIVIESLPFVVLGVFISLLLGLFVSEKFIIKFLPKNRFTSHIFLSFLGVLAPVCQCGNVPVARRLMLQGLSVSQATTFLLAAPIINPITAITTLAAFSTNYNVAIVRIISGFLISNTLGIIVSYKKDQTLLLSKEFNKQLCNINHAESKTKFSYVIQTFSAEFVPMMAILTIGALIAGASQIFIPRNILLTVGHNPVLSVLAMLVLGFIISICSTVDAFFALSYMNSFTIGSITSFLIFGPLVDLKMLAMMKSIYKTKFLVILVSSIALVSFLIGVSMNYFK